MATKRFYLHKEAGSPAVPTGSYTISESAPDQTDANGGGGGHMSTSSGSAASQLNKPQARDNTSVAGEAPTTNPPAAAHQFGWFSDQTMLGQFVTGDWKFVIREDDNNAGITSHWSINIYANTTRNFLYAMRFVRQIHLSVDNWTGTTTVQTQTASVPGFRLDNEYMFVQIWCHETASLSPGQTLTIHQEGSDLTDTTRTNILTSDFALGGRLLSLPGASVGLAPISSATAWAYGSYVQASASISTGIYVTGLGFQMTNIPAVDTTVEQLFEIATGAAASEVTKAQVPHSFRADEVTTSGYYQTKTFNVNLPEPMFIAKGTRVAVRATDSLASAITYAAVQIMYREAFDPPTVVLDAPADAASVADTTPALDFTGTSEGSFELEYNVQIDTVNTFASVFLDKLSVSDAGFTDITDGGDTHPFASNDQIDYTVQAGDALAANTYYWRVSAIDPLGGNVYGAWSATRSFTVTAGSTGIKVWNGTTWDYKPVKVWDGGAWVVKPVKVWSGAAWVVKG